MIGLTISHYKILEKLGEGGMGVVYKAQDTALDRFAALKFLPAHVSRSEPEKARFIQEAKSASALNHPNVCTIYGIEDVDNRLYIAMEFVDGSTLRDKVSTAGGASGAPLPIKQAVDYAIQIAEALAEAHGKGIIHRDIKSENIMVNAKNQIKVMDFGLAKLKGSLNLTRTSSTIGTLAYMSPEQIQGAEADARSDIFSFGVVLFEVVTGKMPFRGEHDAAVMYSIVNEEPEDASKYRDDIPGGLLHIISKTLEKDPEDRYQSMAEIIVDLRRLRKESTRVVRPQDSPAAAPMARAAASSRTVKERPPAREALFSKKVLGAIAALVLVIVLIIVFRNQIIPGIGAKNEKKVIAVLPFENLGAADKDYFVDGMTDEVTSRLSGLSGLKVIARSSTTLYKKTSKTIAQIGAELGVTYILQGTVRWETVGGETHVRVNPTLIKVDDGTQAWSESMESVLSSAFKLQSDIASRVASAMDIALAQTERKSLATSLTENAEAYDYYLQGLEYASRSDSKSDFEIATKLFEKAIRIDPSFAAAYAKLSYMYSNMYWFFYDRSETGIEHARQLAEKAIALAPTLSEAYDAMGWYYYHARLDYAHALEQFALALKYSPNKSTIHYGIAAVMRRQGNERGAEDEFKIAIAGNPRSAELIRQLAETQTLLRDYDAANATYDRTIELSPDITVLYYQKMRNLLSWNGDIAGARRIIEDAHRMGKDDNGPQLMAFMHYVIDMMDGKYQSAEDAVNASGVIEIMDNQYFYSPKPLMRAYCEALRGSTAKARQSFDSARVVVERKLKESPDDARLYSSLGLALAGLGRTDDAVRAGQRGVELLPVEKEAWRGSFRLIDLAEIYTMTGGQEKAIDILERVLAIPAEISPVSLKLEPRWIPLRGNKRFQKLVAG
jgi:TolB-like protein/Flp pilus assembly protein TadD/predicted Ser/Thr protein kinase